MGDLSRFPHELVLLLIEEACRTYVHPHAGWVASLCHVCKSIQSVVTPILYARLFLYEHGMVALNALLLSGAPNRLSLVCEVFFDFGACSWFDDPDTVSNGVYADFATLARALDSIRVLSGPSYVIGALANGNPRLRLQLAAVFVTDSTALWRSRAESHSFGMLLRSLKYLHLVMDLERVRYLASDLALLGGSADAVQFLLVDVLDDIHSPLAVATLDKLIPALSTAVRTVFPNIQRLLLRPRCALEENSHRLTAQFAAWAEIIRNPRIFVDDCFVSIYDGKQYVYDKLDEEDALEGEALWRRGRQLWQGTG
ncbi:hypothetical protein EXIGLDRAFT_729220 [Exidia glandulosa HHB12029]|uniref:F-box domain-containing protein n=1 Tax=Exidia glandulosa HHB12029 TaxID=1314781 RepID=A0A165LMF1_EXIGL|nr:hypothetical protein EXIGLDRAFT_729220 [Exidia glandulosa HHB12029]